MQKKRDMIFEHLTEWHKSLIPPLTINSETSRFSNLHHKVSQLSNEPILTLKFQFKFHFNYPDASNSDRNLTRKFEG